MIVVLWLVANTTVHIIIIHTTNWFVCKSCPMKRAKLAVREHSSKHAYIQTYYVHNQKKQINIGESVRFWCICDIALDTCFYVSSKCLYQLRSMWMMDWCACWNRKHSEQSNNMSEKQNNSNDNDIENTKIASFQLCVCVLKCGIWFIAFSMCKRVILTLSGAVEAYAHRISILWPWWLLLFAVICCCLCSSHCSYIPYLSV